MLETSIDERLMLENCCDACQEILPMISIIQKCVMIITNCVCMYT